MSRQRYWPFTKIITLQTWDPLSSRICKFAIKKTFIPLNVKSNFIALCKTAGTIICKVRPCLLFGKNDIQISAIAGLAIILKFGRTRKEK